MEITQEEREFLKQALHALPLQGNVDSLVPTIQMIAGLLQKLEDSNGAGRETDGPVTRRDN
jgi:hypothetical protein